MYPEELLYDLQYVGTIELQSFKIFLFTPFTHQIGKK